MRVFHRNNGHRNAYIHLFSEKICHHKMADFEGHLSPVTPCGHELIASNMADFEGHIQQKVEI